MHTKSLSHHLLWPSFSFCSVLFLLSNLYLRVWRGAFVFWEYLTISGRETLSSTIPMNSESKCNKSTNESIGSMKYLPRTRIARFTVDCMFVAIILTWRWAEMLLVGMRARTRSWHNQSPKQVPLPHEWQRVGTRQSASRHVRSIAKLLVRESSQVLFLLEPISQFILEPISQFILKARSDSFQTHTFGRVGSIIFSALSDSLPPG